jgi:hypothetical protein
MAALTSRASGKAMSTTLRRRPSLNSTVKVQSIKPRTSTEAICSSSTEKMFWLCHPLVHSTRLGETLTAPPPVPCAIGLSSILAFLALVSTPLLLHPSRSLYRRRFVFRCRLRFVRGLRSAHRSSSEARGPFATSLCPRFDRSKGWAGTSGSRTGRPAAGTPRTPPA